MYTHTWVRANMAPLYGKRKVKRQIGVSTGEHRNTNRAFSALPPPKAGEPIYEEVTETVPTGEYSDTYIDIEDFARRIAEACNGLYESGYDVIKITEVIDGRYNYKVDEYGRAGNGGAPTCYSYGYGYSVTDGVVIIGKKREAFAVL